MFVRLLLRLLCAALIVAPFSHASKKEEKTFYGAQLEEWEYRAPTDGGHGELLAWHGDAFIGNDKIRFRWISEGEYILHEGEFEHAENRIVAQKPVSEFFDIKAGLRLDYYGGGKDRWYAVAGATGLAPQWFEVDADFFISETGGASARLDAEYELLFTNYLALIASAESTYAFAADRKAETGTRLNDLEAGVRLSYDWIDRSVAPYIGAVYEKKYGETAAMARAEGEKEEQWYWVIGVKLKL